MYLKIDLCTGVVLAGCAKNTNLFHGQGLWVAGKFRLDNRRDICRRLNLPEGISDNQLIAEGYCQLGTQVINKMLLGDFAYALYDAQKRMLMLVRDPLGVTPLYYHVRDEVCLVATSLDILLAEVGCVGAVDDGVVADWLMCGHVHHQKDTFFKNIKKVPRASQLIIHDRHSIQREVYWSVDDVAPLRYTNEAHYVEHLHDLLETVVHDRLDMDEITGAHSSGGLDSTPIALMAGRHCQANGHHFYTYNWCKPDTKDGAFCHEWDDARIVSKNAGFIHHEVGVDANDLEFSLLNHNIARDGSTMFEYERRLLVRAQADGVKRIFSGFGGDELLTSRFRDRHAIALRQGQLLHVLRRLIQESDPAQSMYLPRLALNFARQLRQAWWPAPKEKQAWFQQQQKRYEACRSLIKPDFAAFAADQGASDGALFLAETIAEKQHLMLNMGYHQERMESWAILGERHGVRYVYPYLDKRIVEFAFALPAEWYYRKGRPRYLYTKALGDALPESLRNKPKLPESERVRMLVQQRIFALSRPAVLERVAARCSAYVDTGILVKRLQALATCNPADWQALIPEVRALSYAVHLLNVA